MMFQMRHLMIPFSLAAALSLCGQDIEHSVDRLGSACDPEVAGPAQCPGGTRDAESGVVVSLRSFSGDHDAYRIRVTYVDSEGKQRTATALVERAENGKWTVQAFRIGRVDVVTVNIQKLATTGAVITPGATIFGPPHVVVTQPVGTYRPVGMFPACLSSNPPICGHAENR